MATEEFASPKNDHEWTHPALSPAPQSVIRHKQQTDSLPQVKAKRLFGPYRNSSGHKVATISLLPPVNPETQHPGPDTSKLQSRRCYITAEFRLQRPVAHELDPGQASEFKTKQLVTYYGVGDHNDAGMKLLVPFDEITQYVSAREREEWENRPEKADALDQMMEEEDKKLEERKSAADRAAENLFLQEAEAFEWVGRTVTRGMAKTIRYSVSGGGLS
ncbi:hypothetical protein B0T21DRAFT_348290 [Apiosordaria backusii]|uniref:Uncharacterized protein n=1 Tax=Apiosordaria backusii TaxID=314023 RepID=A0AA40BL31_9PEZI|nr:hypothetical protein B0T21DRAFT_348290 [Apiosordaria backusii]